MTPVFPGSTFLSHVPAVVQPQPGRTSAISSVEVPVLVNTNLCFTTSLAPTFPKSYTRESNSMRGPLVGAPASVPAIFAGLAAGVAGLAGGEAGAPKPEATPPMVNALIKDFRR